MERRTSTLWRSVRQLFLTVQELVDVLAIDSPSFERFVHIRRYGDELTNDFKRLW